MGAALTKTTKLVIGTGVTAPILRYRHAIVAQVFATLAYIFPNWVFLGLGRGEALMKCLLEMFCQQIKKNSGV